PGTLTAFDLAEAGYERLRFLARSGAPGRQFRLAVRVTDVYSEPSAGLCVHAVLECGASTCSCEAPQGGCDHQTVEVVVADDWLLYELPLSSFGRGGWGTFFDEAGVPPAELDISRAHQVQFFVPTDGDPLPEFDLWLDDIGFTLASAEPGDPSTV